MTPKGAAVLPRPFCCPFFCFPSHPSSRSPCPATCCQLFADFRRRRRQLFVNFYPRSLGKSWLFVNFLRHFAQCPATYCQLFADFRRHDRQLFVNFYPRPLGQSLHFVNFWRHFAHLRRAFCHLLFPFLPYFRFFCKCRVFSCKNRRPLPSFEKGQAKAFRSALSLPNIKS